MFTDIHTHILHSIDDGPENFEQTIKLLDKAVQNGVDKLVVTPHFYAERHSLKERLDLFDKRYFELCEYVSQNKIPISLLGGFEVRFFKGISKVEGLNRLCINGSSFLLLELGYLAITEDVVDEILNLRYAGYDIVLAHIERYAKLPGFKQIKSLIMEGEVLAQCNAESFISGPFQRIAFKLLKQGMVSIIASDMHSLDNRPPNLKDAYEVIENKLNSRVKKQLMAEAEELFSRCTKK